MKGSVFLGIRVRAAQYCTYSSEIFLVFLQLVYIAKNIFEKILVPLILGLVSLVAIVAIR